MIVIDTWAVILLPQGGKLGVEFINKSNVTGVLWFVSMLSVYIAGHYVQGSQKSAALATLKEVSKSKFIYSSAGGLPDFPQSGIGRGELF